jgi:hypothetical protein
MVTQLLTIAAKTACPEYVVSEPPKISAAKPLE